MLHNWRACNLRAREADPGGLSSEAPLHRSENAALLSIRSPDAVSDRNARACRPGPRLVPQSAWTRGILSRLFWIPRLSDLSKYATDDQGQKDQRSGQEQSGNSLFSNRNAASSS